MGRPKGKVSQELSLRPVWEVVRELLPEEDVTWVSREFATTRKQFGRVVLMENLRFNAGEEKNDADFAKKLLELTGTELVVLDAFPVMHRRHASVDAITRLGVPAVGGISLVEEIENLSQVFDAAHGKKVAVVSGAKVEDKAAAIEGLATRGFTVLVGGLIAARGYRSANPNVIVAHDFHRDNGGSGEVLGIGSETLNIFIKQIESAGVIVWAGPVSWIEVTDPKRKPYDLPSLMTALAITKATERGAFTCVLGGDTGAFWSRMISKGYKLECSYRSKGGGAALEFLATGSLPGIVALEEAAERIWA
jgi:phosphoglycerate kinase